MRMGIKDKILMPFHLSTPTRPFEVQHDLPEPDIGPQKISRNIGNNRIGADSPKFKIQVVKIGRAP